MTHRQVATLACKVLAIWALIRAIDSSAAPLQTIITIWQYMQRGVNVPSNYWNILLNLVPLALHLIVAIWLWKRAGVVASWMTGHDLQDEADERESTPRRADIDQVQAVVLSSLGVWVMLDVVPQIASTIFQVLLTWIASRGQIAMANRVVDSSVWVWSFQMLLGLWLIFGAPGITRLLKRARGEPAATSD